jgi:DNA-binding HxlR family transcriptional regulator
MALAQNYDQQDCPVARALELVGERWTMLIIRDCFLGVSRFNDFLDHLDIPKATLSSRLDKLVDFGVLRRKEYRAGQSDYILTEQGEALWPILYSLAAWGEAYRAPSRGPRRIFSHAACATVLDSSGACPTCKIIPPAADVVIQPGPGAIPNFRDDAIERALQKPHRFLTRLADSEIVARSESEPPSAVQDDSN